MDIIQDAAAIDQEMEYQQQQLQDIIAQQTSKMSEGLEDEYDKLDELEMLEAMDAYEAPPAQTQKAPAQAAKKTENSYDNLLNDLLS